MKQKTENTLTPAPAAVPVAKPKPVLTAEQIAKADKVVAYCHPKSARTVAYHYDAHAYTVTGLPAGDPDTVAAKAARDAAAKNEAKAKS